MERPHTGPMKFPGEVEAGIYITPGDMLAMSNSDYGYKVVADVIATWKAPVRHQYAELTEGPSATGQQKKPNGDVTNRPAAERFRKA